MTRAQARPRLRVGISSCLLGQEVRWNGAHKRDAWLVETLGRFVEWVPVCPEMEIGLGVPREPIRLEGDPAAPRLIGRESGADLTGPMQAFAARRVEALAALDLCGYILKSDSPSCGMERVKVHGPAPGRPKPGVGLFARALMRRLPLLPVEEEGRLHDPGLRESFIERVFAFRRLRDLLASRPAAGRLVEFHARHKLLLMAHDPEGARRLGRIVAGARGARARDAAERYAASFMETLKRRATPKKHANVLQHMLGYLKRGIDPGDKQEILEAIDAMRREELPLAVPLALLRHHLRRHDVRYLLDQVYLEPHPRALRLGNHD
ncbi:MAG TPA: DUF523 and DUF1722 domain-containing protein [Candidatus Polarisedimenticolia bacterium]|nr:DUF523 and DUF1722 domain-containing protein [Candidatus Polarisedimenticolia bacterium]